MEPGAALVPLAGLPCAVPAAGRAVGAHAPVRQRQAVLPLHRRPWLRVPLTAGFNYVYDCTNSEYADLHKHLLEMVSAVTTVQVLLYGLYRSTQVSPCHALHADLL